MIRDWAMLWSVLAGAGIAGGRIRGLRRLLFLRKPVGVEPAEGSGRVQRLFGLVQLIPIFGTGE